MFQEISARERHDDGRLSDLITEVACPVNSGVKRVIDFVLSIVLILFFSPIFLLVAALIALDSRGPIIFRQNRGGLGGAPFKMYKFRTMTVLEDDDLVQQATRNDGRVTRVGAFLRKSSLDEFPQLLNVFQGDMSLVGPRPHVLSHDRQFKEIHPGYDRRFAVKPGITGLAQVRGFRGETRNVESVVNRVDADLEYVATWSVCGDLKILFLTAAIPFLRTGY